MKEFYLYSEKNINQLLNQMFINFQVHNTSLATLKKENFINQNIFLIVNEAFEESFHESFFYKNNVVIFYTTNNNLNRKTLYEKKTFNKPININKFIDEVTTFFAKNSIICLLSEISPAGETILSIVSDNKSTL